MGLRGWRGACSYGAPAAAGDSPTPVIGVELSTQPRYRLGAAGPTITHVELAIQRAQTSQRAQTQDFAASVFAACSAAWSPMAFMTASVAAPMNFGRFAAAQSRDCTGPGVEPWNSGIT